MQKSNELIKHPSSALALSITENLKPENTLKNDHIHTHLACAKVYFFPKLVSSNNWI